MVPSSTAALIGQHHSLATLCPSPVGEADAAAASRCNTSAKSASASRCSTSAKSASAMARQHHDPNHGEVNFLVYDHVYEGREWGRGHVHGVVPLEDAAPFSTIQNLTEGKDVSLVSMVTTRMPLAQVTTAPVAAMASRQAKMARYTIPTLPDDVAGSFTIEFSALEPPHCSAPMSRQCPSRTPAPPSVSEPLTTCPSPPRHPHGHYDRVRDSSASEDSRTLIPHTLYRRTRF